MSEGVGEARVEAEGELALARIALDEGDHAHAAAHLGNAIAADPSLAAAYAALGELDAAAGGALGLFPVASRAYAGEVAARSYLLACAGAFGEALSLLCSLASLDPGKPWAAPGWLDAPGVAGQLDPEAAAGSLMQLAFSLPTPVDAALSAALLPFLELARALAARNPGRPGVLATLSGLARRLGAQDEAIAWCQQAERAEPSFFAAVMLGYALRSAGRFREMHEAWRRALDRNPGDIDLRVDIAETLAEQGRPAEGIGWLEQALALDPDHPKAFPSACAMRYTNDGDVAHLVTLADWRREHPEHGYAGEMLVRGCWDRVWLQKIPHPTEAACNTLLQIAARPDREAMLAGELRLTLSALEVPSALAAVKAAAPQLRLDIQSVPQPDIRIPLAAGRYRIWDYQGTEAAPAVAPPSAAAAAALQALAAGGYRAHPAENYDASVALAMLSLDDLLGLLAHVPPVPDHAWWREMHARSPVYWPRCAQVWACLGVLHQRPDEPWPSSVRRAVLLDLARGVEDWVTDAALNAMMVEAWVHPEIRADVAAVIGHRFLDAVQAWQQRDVSIAGSMASLVLVTPAMNPDVTRLVRELLAREAAAGGADPGTPAPARPGARPAAVPAPARRRLFRRSS